MGTKVCWVCEVPLPTLEFNRDQGRKDGLTGRCRSCSREELSKYRADHKDELAAYGRNWKKENPDKVNAHTANRRARKAGVVGDVTEAEFEELKQATGNICLSCLISGDEVTLARDHVIPISQGEPNVIENIQPLCKSCNSKKGTKSTDYRRQK